MHACAEASPECVDYTIANFYICACQHKHGGDCSQLGHVAEGSLC